MKTRVRPRRDAPASVFHTKEEYVASFLREGILSGEIERGARLKQADLAEQLGLSITPVREALKLLAAEGYVLGATHRGAIVAPFEIEAATEAIELRALLETRLTVAAMRRMTLGDMEQTQRLAQDYERAHDTADVALARATNYRFHRFLYGLAGQPLGLRFTQVLWVKYPFDLLFQIPERTGASAREHARLIDALVSRDEQAAAAAIREHLYAGWTALKSAFQGESAPPPARATP